MRFNKDDFTVDKLVVGNEEIEIRSFRNRVYVEKPICEEFQQMNIFAPEIYYQGGSINGYRLNTAPIFMPNLVGGYMPGGLGEPLEREGAPNTILRALQHGYVVAVPAIRGRVLKNELGEYTGKAPACIVDYKAAVRYLRYFSKELPGDVEKIITNGTSAGGALSSLMGATGNHPDYATYLTEIGAADERDDIFAASCYCPIINLDNADMAYEWQFFDVNSITDNGRDMSEFQVKISKELAALFPQYLNRLKLKDENGNILALDETGNGAFKEYVKQIVIKSAQKAIDDGINIFDKKWLTVCGGKVTDMDWHGYVKDITRMKLPPAFDALTADSPENDLFGNELINVRHFTKYSEAKSLCDAERAEDFIVKMLNPMNYIEDDKAEKAKHWRIRHGECDRDTSLAISAMFALKLKAQHCEVDYHSPWDVPHTGDYDLDELFKWIDEICCR